MQPAETVAHARSDYAELLRRVKEAGLLNRHTVYSVARRATIAIVLVRGWVTFALWGRSWWQPAVAAQPLVRAFCAERGVPYLESTLLGCYGQAVGHLCAVGRV